jgi:hypothetical protein
MQLVCQTFAQIEEIGAVNKRNDLVRKYWLKGQGGK